MGWTFHHNSTKAELVADIIQPTNTAPYRTLNHKLAGSELWTLMQKDGEAPVIVLFLLQKDGDNYGYKDMDESMGPYYYKVPQSFLDRAPVTCQSWRDRVAAQASLKALRAAKFASLKPGDLVRLDGCTIDEVQVCRVEKNYFVGQVTVGPTKNIGIGRGSIVRVKKDFILA